MLLKDYTHHQQSELATYCRTNQLSESLKVRKAHVHHYRRLVFNVVNDSLQSAFPLTLNLIHANEWDQLVHQFFSQYKPQSPQVWKMPGEFYQWFCQTEQPLHEQFPFLNDLLYFEWQEVALFMMEDQKACDYSDHGDWLESEIILNPEYSILQVAYPVHLKKADNITKADQAEYFILMFREKESGRIQFMDIAPYYSVLIQNIALGNNVQSILEAIQKQMPQTSLSDLQKNTIPFLEKLKEKGFIFGFSG